MTRVLGQQFAGVIAQVLADMRNAQAEKYQVDRHDWQYRVQDHFAANGQAHGFYSGLKPCVAAINRAAPARDFRLLLAHRQKKDPRLWRGSGPLTRNSLLSLLGEHHIKERTTVVWRSRMATAVFVLALAQADKPRQRKNGKSA